MHGCHTGTNAGYFFSLPPLFSDSEKLLKHLAQFGPISRDVAASFTADLKQQAQDSLRKMRLAEQRYQARRDSSSGTPPAKNASTAVPTKYFDKCIGGVALNCNQIYRFERKIPDPLCVMYQPNCFVNINQPIEVRINHNGTPVGIFARLRQVGSCIHFAAL